MYSLKKFKHLDNNYLLVELDDKVKNNFLSSFLIGIDNKFLKLDTADLNESTNYYKDKLNNKIIEKFDGKKFNKLSKKHLTYLADLCKMNLVIFDLNKLNLKFSTDLDKRNKTVYLFKHGKKEYLLMRQNVRGMVSKLPVSIYKQFGGDTTASISGSKVIPIISKGNIKGNKQEVHNVVVTNKNILVEAGKSKFDILYNIINDDKELYYKERIKEVIESKKLDNFDEKNKIKIVFGNEQSKDTLEKEISVKSFNLLVELIDFFNLNEETNASINPITIGGGKYHYENFDLQNRINDIKYIHDPSHDFNKPMPRNLKKDGSNSLLSGFNYNYFYKESNYENLASNSEEDFLRESGSIEDKFLNDIINIDTKNSFLTYKTDSKDLQEIFLKIKNNANVEQPDKLTDFREKIGTILDGYKYYEFDALNSISPLDDEKYSGKDFKKYVSLCSIIDGSGVNSIDITKKDYEHTDDYSFYENDENQDSKIYTTYFKKLTDGYESSDELEIKLEYNTGYNQTPDPRFLKISVNIQNVQSGPFYFKDGGFNVDNLVCMMMMIKDTDEKADSINIKKFNSFYGSNFRLQQLYEFINFIWIHFEKPSIMNLNKKNYLYRLLFTLKLIGDHGQANFVKKWNDKKGHGDKMIIVTNDRMFFHYCIIKGVPVYFQNNKYIIINTDVSIHDNVYINLSDYDESQFLPKIVNANFGDDQKDALDAECIKNIYLYIDNIINLDPPLSNELKDLSETIGNIRSDDLDDLNYFDDEVKYNYNISIEDQQIKESESNPNITIDKIFYEELDEIKDEVIEKYLIQTIKEFVKIDQRERVKIFNYIKKKIITAYDRNYFYYSYNLRNKDHAYFFDELFKKIQKEFEFILIDTLANVVAILETGEERPPRVLAYFQDTVEDLKSVLSFDIETRSVIKIIEDIVFMYNETKILNKDKLKEKYVEYLKGRLIINIKNKKFNDLTEKILENFQVEKDKILENFQVEKDKILENFQVEKDKKLLKDFIRKHVEIKFNEKYNIVKTEKKTIL